jgi:hypothetical protein
MKLQTHHKQGGAGDEMDNTARTEDLIRHSLHEKQECERSESSRGDTLAFPSEKPAAL